VKIATYNVNGIRSRLRNLLAWLERERPDAACLQELKAPDEAFPQAALREAGYEAVWHGQKSWNGVAILARGTEPEETRRGLPGIDGYEVATEIRRRSAAHPPRLVAVTGYGQDRDRAKGRQAGFDAHLVKPAAYDAIAKILESVGAAERRT
jgi:exodeoxyribonuclease III